MARRARTILHLLEPCAHTDTMLLLLLTGWLWLLLYVQSVAGTACSSSPCGGGGTCLPDYNNNYYCQCPADRTHDNCQQWRLPLFPELKPYAGTQSMSTDHHFFNGLSNQQQGSLRALSFYARQAGTFWLDLWRHDGGGSYTLVYSRSFTVTTNGQHDVNISPVVVLEPGVSLTVGVHSSSSLTNPLGVTLGAGYLVWRTAWVEGDFVVGTTTLTSSDNTDSAPVYMIPSIWLRATASLGCSPQQELDVIDRPSEAIGGLVHIFLGLTTKCAGRLSSISIYAEATGTVYIDLWQETDSGTDLVLYFTKEILVDSPGQHIVSVYEEAVYVVEGLIYATHRPGFDENRLIADGQTDPDEPVYETLRYSGAHENFAWTPNVLRSSHFTESHANIDRTPSVAVYIIPATASQECEEGRSLPPLLPGLAEPPPGLTLFPGVNTSCTAAVTGVSFYASVPGSFYVAMFNARSDPDVYSLNFKEKVSINMTGLQHVTLQNLYFLNQGDVLGIFDDPTSPNALRYVENTELLKAAVEYEHTNMSQAHHLQLAAGDVTADSPTIALNESTRTTVHFPPLQLHLQYEGEDRPAKVNSLQGKGTAPA